LEKWIWLLLINTESFGEPIVITLARQG